MEGKTDAELAELVSIDREAYGFLMRRYEGRLLGYLRRLSNIRHEDAEDILQEVFIKAYLNLNSFDRRLKFSSWIYRIAHNEAVSHWRRNKNRPQPLLTEDEDAAAEMAAKLSVDPELAEQFDRTQTAEAVRAAIAGLDDKYRDILILRYLEEKDYAEISDILCKPMGTVATLLNRAKQALRLAVVNNKAFK